jgi:isoquinoline 1-oxidoreductase alpha subunit
MKYNLKINGQNRAVDVDPQMPLLWVLRDALDLKGTKFGCGMTAAALLAKTPKPTDTDIDSAMAGNICRCATYTRIRAAIKQAAGLPTTDTREA